MKTILVADDEPHIRRLIQVNLERAGYRVVSVENGKHALERLQQGRINLLVTDYMMPEMDGFELADAILASGEPLASLPILFLFHYQNYVPDPRTLLKPEWKSGYLFKPFNSMELVQAVNRLFETS